MIESPESEVIDAEEGERQQDGKPSIKRLSKKDIRRRDFILNGNLWLVIIKISLPLMLFNAFNYLYTIIDSILAREISSQAISTVVVLSQLNNMFASLGAGFASGGIIIISRLIGRNDYEKAKKAACTMISLSVIVAVSIILIVVPLTTPILKLVRTPDELIDLGTKYFAILTITTGITLFNSLFLGLEKASGKTWHVLVYNFSIMAIKLISSALFIYGFKLRELHYIALSTLIANLCLTFFVIARLSSKDYLFHFSFKQMDFGKKFISPIFILSFPIFLGRFVFSLGKVIINSMCGRYGDKVVGALGVSNNLGGFTTNVLSSVEESTNLIISTNLGQKNLQRALGAFYRSFVFTIGISLLGITILTIFNDQIVSFYANGDAEFGQMVDKIFSYEKLGVFALALNSSVLALLYGYGYTRTSMMINLARLFVFRIPSLYLMMNFTNLGWQSVGIAMLISNGGIGLMSVAIGIIYLIKIKKQNITDRLVVG